MPKCEHGLTSKECYVCASPKYAEQAEKPVAWEDVLGAIARGWAHPENARKPMDVQLAVAIAKEIQDMYTHPPQHKPLTDEEIGKIILETEITLKNYCDVDLQTDFARRIERAHGIGGEA